MSPLPHRLEEHKACQAGTQRRKFAGGDDNGDGDVDPDSRPKRAQVTRKNLGLLERMTGEDKEGASPSDSPSSTASTHTKAISTLPSGFADQASRSGILSPRRSKPPADLEHLVVRLDRSRGSASEDLMGGDEGEGGFG